MATPRVAELLRGLLVAAGKDSNLDYLIQSHPAVVDRAPSENAERNHLRGSRSCACLKRTGDYGNFAVEILTVKGDRP
jgi:hypothetical protein